jgi:hypothetical protein
MMIAALLPVGVQLASASSAPVLSGSYSVVQSRALGNQMQIRVRMRLTNSGPSDLSIQRITLWNSSHPEKGGSHARAVTLRARSSADTMQEFTVSRSDYRQWQKGFRPRIVLEVAARTKPGRPATRSTAVVRLDHGAGQEAR